MNPVFKYPLNNSISKFKIWYEITVGIWGENEIGVCCDYSAQSIARKLMGIYIPLHGSNYYVKITRVKNSI